MLEVKPPKENKTYNVAVYTRLSAEDTLYKNGSGSLANQRELILDYLKNKPDMKVYSVCCDNGETGTNFDHAGCTSYIRVKSGRHELCRNMQAASRYEYHAAIEISL